MTGSPVQDNQPFQRQSTWGAEVGVKASWRGDVLEFNAAQSG